MNFFAPAAEGDVYCRLRWSGTHTPTRGSVISPPPPHGSPRSHVPFPRLHAQEPGSCQGAGGGAAAGSGGAWGVQ